MFLVRGERNLYPVNSFNCGNHPPVPPGQHLVKVGRVRISQKAIGLKKTEQLSDRHLQVFLRGSLTLKKWKGVPVFKRPESAIC
ncbi:hypothetical protein R6Z07F_008619 [Ovis aries]